MPTYLLIPGFLLVAAIYAAVGFGGGSTYNALLVLAGVDYRAVPVVALSCNIIVVTGGVFHLARSGHFTWRPLLPFISASIPMAWLGGRMPVSESVFAGLLGLALLLTALHLFSTRFSRPAPSSVKPPTPWRLGLPSGAAIGLLSGIVGVGGGIFLAPLLYLFSFASPRHIAGMCSGFILVNSLAGLGGQLAKHGSFGCHDSWLAYWPLYLAVLVGGQAGSRLAAAGLPERYIRLGTGVLVLYVGVRLLLRWAELVLA